MLLAPDKKQKSAQVIPHDALRIRGKSYEIREIWYSVLNPQAPPVVVVRKIDKETGT